MAKGLNFAVTPKDLPVKEYVTVTETACRSLPPNEAEELRSRVSNILRHHRTVTPNISKEEIQALDTLRKDKSIKILPADKGRCAVILDTEEYMKKCKDLLSDTNTYEKLKKDPTSSYKKQLVSVLKDLKQKGVVSDQLYRRIYPTTETPPKFYGLPKIHKPNHPLRPIVSSIGSITYPCAKYLAEIISPVIGKTKHHIKNSQHFAETIQNYRVEEDEELRSYDVSALFTSVPVDKAADVIQQKLEQDPSLHERTDLSPSDITRLLRFCLNCTYFVFDGEFYRQIHGAAMGSPVSPSLVMDTWRC